MTRKIAVALVSLLALSHASTADARRSYRVTVDVTTTPPGASVYVDDAATPAGKTPTKLRLRSGKRTLRFELEGYKEVTRQLTLRRRTTVDLTLARRPRPAELTLSGATGSNLTGSAVTINGLPSGTLPTVASLAAGRYLVVVSKTGFAAWQSWVTLAEAERRTVVVSLVALKPKTGSLLVGANVTGADVRIDDKSVGSAPALVPDLMGGAHVLEVRAPNHKPYRKTITIDAGKTNRIAVDLEPIQKASAAQGGLLHVLGEPSDVEVYVDGVSRGNAPVKVTNLNPGTHHVEARRPGYHTAERTIAVSVGQSTTIKLRLEKLVPLKTPAAVAAKTPATAAPTAAGSAPGADPTGAVGYLALSTNPRGAKAAIDGRPIGVTPIPKAKVAVGKRKLTITHPKYKTLERTITIDKDKTVTLALALDDKGTPDAKKKDDPAVAKADAAAKDAEEAKADDDAPTEELDTKGLSSFGAQLVPPGYFTADLAIGYPYLGVARATAGVFDKGHFGLDLGIELRTYGTVTEIGAVGKFRIVHLKPIALAAFAAAGGGGGPRGRNTFYFNTGVALSLVFKGILTFTARGYLNLYTDRLCATTASDNETSGCKVPATAGFDPRDRHTGWRFMTTAALEIPIVTHLGAFVLVEGAPFQRERFSFTDPFAAFMLNEDPLVYGRAGVSVKF